MIQIREASPQDAPGVARVHVQSWQETYKGIVPDSYVAALSVPKREAFWKSFLAESKDKALFVAVSGDDIVGFANCGPTRELEMPFQAELYAIYLLQSHQGRGIGKQLMETVTTWLRARGYGSMMLWVLQDNPTLNFYKHCGGQIVAAKQVEIGGVELDEVAVGWSMI